MTAGNLMKLPGGIAGITNARGNATVACGRGRVTVFASPFGVEADATVGLGLRSETDKQLLKPFKLVPDVRLGLEEILRSQQLFALAG